MSNPSPGALAQLFELVGSRGLRLVAECGREPAAVVRVHGFDRLISAAGELLPVDYPSGTSKLRFVTGVSQPAPVAFGEVWTGGDVQAGLELLAYLQSTPVYSQVAGVDVIIRIKGGRHGHDPHFVFGVPPIIFNNPSPASAIAAKMLPARNVA